MAIDPEQPCFLRLPVKCLKTVVQALRKAGFKSEAQDVLSFTRDYTDEEANTERLRWLELADAVARDGEIEFDSDSTISHSEGGEYVLGWVWVEDDEEEEDDEDGGGNADEVEARHEPWGEPR